MIPRYYFKGDKLSQLHLISFYDASTHAAYAVVYTRSVNFDRNIVVNFVCAKSRIAPVKPTNIHRLELVAALLLAKLVSEVSIDLDRPIESLFCFLDSQVVLSG